MSLFMQTDADILTTKTQNVRKTLQLYSYIAEIYAEVLAYFSTSFSHAEVLVCVHDVSDVKH